MTFLVRMDIFILSKYQHGQVPTLFVPPFVVSHHPGILSVDIILLNFPNQLYFILYRDKTRVLYLRNIELGRCRTVGYIVERDFTSVGYDNATFK